MSRVFEYKRDKNNSDANKALSDQMKYKTLTTLSENIPFTFTLLIYVVDNDNKELLTTMNYNEIKG